MAGTTSRSNCSYRGTCLYFISRGAVRSLSSPLVSIKLCGSQKRKLSLPITCWAWITCQSTAGVQETRNDFHYLPHFQSTRYQLSQGALASISVQVIGGPPNSPRLERCGQQYLDGWLMGVATFPSVRVSFQNWEGDTCKISIEKAEIQLVSE